MSEASDTRARDTRAQHDRGPEIREPSDQGPGGKGPETPRRAPVLLDEARVDAYLARLGTARPPRADLATLRELHRAHLCAVPFENLSVHLGEEIRLAPDALVDKIVRARRGGFCYELNGAFAALLRTLGYEVTLLAARVHTEAGLTPPFDHLALRVDLPEEGAPGAASGAASAPVPWLVDVGFGRFAHLPLRLDVLAEQHDPGGVFRLVELPHGDLDVLRDGAPQYRLEGRPRELAEFTMGAWYNSTSPRSHFTRKVTCSRLTEAGGRVTLSGRTLVTTDAAGQRAEAELSDDAAVLAAYRDHFGIGLDRVPEVRTPAAG
ncbi:arylamine N-acetyltransferase family protein [Streptomyces sp. 4N509B]|uniref:arylamine N-acetyltransferase family protein n=1 Tax=Streptomyces sp. 4N509B TaxID=3457413 RepID=UPI003FD0D0B7